MRSVLLPPICVIALPLMLVGGCPSGINIDLPGNGGGTDGARGQGGEPSLDDVPDDALDAQIIGAGGGALSTPDPLDSSRSIEIVFPPNAVPAGQDAAFYIRELATLGAREFEAEPVDVYDAARQFGEPQDGVITHPLYGALAQAQARRFHIGPTLELGPPGTAFAKPVEIRIPFEVGRWTDEELAAAAMFTGEYVADEQLMRGTRVVDVDVDPEAGVLTARVEHFSIFQGAVSFLTEAGSRVISLVRRAANDLPDAPDATDAIAEKIVCSGIQPRVVLSEMPEPLVLLWYLANPADAPSRVTDPNGHIAEREFWERARVVTGREVQLEDWVISQPNKSVTVDDLFGAAYEQSNGDVFKALLLSHNVLRGFDGANRNLDVRGQTIQSRMADFRGDGGDEVGGRYHYFGMAAFGFVLRAVGSFVEDRSRGIVQIPGIDIDEKVTAFIIQFEECLVSGDCMSDEVEYAIDLSGRDLGFVLADELFDNFNDYGSEQLLDVEGATLLQVTQRFGVDSSCGLAVEATADPETIFVGEMINFHAEVTGGVPPYGVGWEETGELITTGTDPVIIFNEAGTFTLKVTASDELGRRAIDSVQVTVLDPTAQGYRVWRVTNYGADGGYITVLGGNADQNPPLLSSLPGGGIDSELRTELTPISEIFPTREAAAASVCGRVCCYYRPALASFILKAQFDGQDVGISGVIQGQCPDP